MANLLVKDANGDIVEIKATGAGTTGDPFIIERLTALGPGTAAIGKLGANSGVDIGDVDVMSIIPGAGATNLGKAEDAAHASGDIGVLLLAVRKDTATALAGTDADYIPLIVDANGRLHIAPLIAGSAIIGKVGIDQTTPGTTNAVAATNLPTNVDTNSGNKSASTLRMVLATDQPQNTTPLLASPLGFAVDVTLTRPADTNVYAANDEISSSTSAPAVNTITGAARASGGMCRLRAASCVDSANLATKAQLLVFVFDTTTTPNNDNTAFTLSDAVLNTCVAVLPFNVWYPGDDTSGAGGNAFSPYLGPEIDIKTVGSANLFFRVKVLNAPTPVSAEAFVFRFDFVQY